ncbi:MAG TPA: LytR C-terminal domain-containing protein [Candidatus Levybacteria bacterium]|nr:LytR C-terminal domain-containing protein [Candidatus Levybacteria bacterium]
MKLKYSKVSVNTFDKPKKIKRVEGEKNEKNPMSYLLYFLLVVGISIFLALALRFIFIYQESRYNTSAFSVLVEAKNPFIVSYDKNLNRLTFLKLKSVEKNKIKESILLGVPIDGRVKAENLSPEKFSSIGTIVNQLFAPWNYTYYDMTIFDSIKLSSLALPIPYKDISFLTLSVNTEGEREGATNEQVYNAFKDSDLLDEQHSIEIINGTDVTGLAGMVGEVLKSAGANVVSIRSTDSVENSTVIASQNSKTMKRIVHLLGIPAGIDESFVGVSDIKIVLGTDFGNKLK